VGTVAANIVTVLIGAAACHVPLHADVYERCLYGRIPRKEHPLLMGLPAWVWQVGSGSGWRVSTLRLWSAADGARVRSAILPDERAYAHRRGILWP